MSDDLIERLRKMSPKLDMLQCEDVLQAADTIERLTAENNRNAGTAMAAMKKIAEAQKERDQLAQALTEANRAAEKIAKERDEARDEEKTATSWYVQAHQEVERLRGVREDLLAQLHDARVQAME